MEQIEKLLFAHIRDDQILELLEAHSEDMDIDPGKQIFTISINKLFAYNILMGRPNREKIEFALEKAFGKPYKLTLKNMAHEQTHDREMAVPHSIRR